MVNKIKWITLAFVGMFTMICIWFMLMAIITIASPFSKKARHLLWKGLSRKSFSETIEGETRK